ncbi:hypothetical protein [Actinomadura geliboluensis]|uniref:hypothetical protein n=1 Tax=Actinomadura geliboluensis TaxID=882440 RepID=UPI0036C14CD1
MTTEEAEALQAKARALITTDGQPALPAFTGVGSCCVKCGARAAKTMYRSANQHAGALLRFEHLERECTRCGYRWPEATIDTRPPAPEANTLKGPADA